MSVDSQILELVRYLISSALHRDYQNLCSVGKTILLALDCAANPERILDEDIETNSDNFEVQLLSKVKSLYGIM